MWKLHPSPPLALLKKVSPLFPATLLLKLRTCQAQQKWGGGGGGGAYYVVTSWNGDRKAIYQDNK